jgi:penicillin-binding protein 1A
VRIGKFYNENRSPVEYEDVNPVFWTALVDTEDERFFSHYGIDPYGLAGALKDAVVHRQPRGASTITQQLAKNMFRIRTQYSTGLLGKIPGISIIIKKSKEWVIATKLEIVYTKQEILKMYANTVDFGSNSFGIKTACSTYFSTSPKEMTTNQAAILVGMLKGTTVYNPILHPDRSLQRRNVVLQNMVAHNHLSEQEYNQLRTQPIDLQYRSETLNNNQWTYFQDAVEANLQEWSNTNGYDLYTSGLKIYTTLDTRIQQYAEMAVRQEMEIVQASFEHDWGTEVPWREEDGSVTPHFIEKLAKKLPVYKYLEKKYAGNTDSIDYYLTQPHKVRLFDYKQPQPIEREMSTLDSLRYMVQFMHCGFIAMDPQTGGVLAWVGDVDYNTWQYDKVSAMHQPGSTFKLFVYTEAMNQGLGPCDKRRDERVSIPIYDTKTHSEAIWCPENASKHFSGDSIPLKLAFARSLNSIAVRLGIELGVKNIIRTAHDIGIKSELDTHPSTVLGASDVNLLEMVNAYSTIANDGKYNEPVLITRIEDQSGNEVYTGPTDDVRTLNYKSAFLMQHMLMGGIKEKGGTSKRLLNYIGDIHDTDFGGKTGTSNNNADAWFMGVTPHLVCGVWIGGEYRNIHFRTGRLGQGAATALPVCGRFFQLLFHDRSFPQYHGRFIMPGGEEIDVNLYNCETVYQPAKSSALSDSLDQTSGQAYDEFGNPIPPRPENPLPEEYEFPSDAIIFEDE